MDNYDTKTKNLSDLTPHFKSREANLKLLKKLEERNLKKQTINKAYRFDKRIDKLKGRVVDAVLNNPQVYAVNQPLNIQSQKDELIRMAKILASNAREKLPESQYNQAKDKFITQYSKKIHEFQLVPQIESIFENFKNQDYNAKGYDNDYLAPGVSSAYLSSLQSKRQSKALKAAIEHSNVKQTEALTNIASILHNKGALTHAMLSAAAPTEAIEDIPTSPKHGSGTVEPATPTITFLEDELKSLYDMTPKTFKNELDATKKYVPNTNTLKTLEQTVKTVYEKSKADPAKWSRQRAKLLAKDLYEGSPDEIEKQLIIKRAMHLYDKKLAVVEKKKGKTAPTIEQSE